jgi:glutamate--cysteine ligase
MTNLAHDTVLSTKEQLLTVFHEAEKPASEFRVGAEMEKFGVDETTGAAIGYDGERGVSAIMAMLEREHRWTPDRETEGGPLIALLRDGASITLEPGSQFELSGAPLLQAHQICAEFAQHLKEIEPISKSMRLRWLGLGFHPFARRADYSFVPKQRYGIMREYLPTRGGLALDMMLRTCTVQANYDYSSEADAMRKMTVSLRLAAVTTAVFANSPFYEGKPFGGRSYRAKVWLDTDPDRSGLVKNLWVKNPSYQGYVDWALGVPMFMFKRDGQKVVNTGQTFQSFMTDGFEGHKATYGDWVTHLNTLFPEVRLKRTIEVRGADAQGSKTACAMPALWTGLLYDEQALAECEALTDGWTFDEVEACRTHIWRDGVLAPFRGGRLLETVQRVVEIAEGGLERRAYKSPRGNDERVHIARIKELVGKGQCPADALLEGLDASQDLTAEIIRRTALL